MPNPTEFHNLCRRIYGHKCIRDKWEWRDGDPYMFAPYNNFNAYKGKVFICHYPEELTRRQDEDNPVPIFQLSGFEHPGRGLLGMLKAKRGDLLLVDTLEELWFRMCEATDGHMMECPELAAARLVLELLEGTDE